MIIVYLDDYRTYRETVARIREALRLMQADQSLYIEPKTREPDDIICAANDYAWRLKPPLLTSDACAGWIINQRQRDVLFDVLAKLNKQGCPKQEAS